MTIQYVLDIGDKGKQFKEKLTDVLNNRLFKKTFQSEIDNYYFTICYEIINDISDTNGVDQYFYRTSLESIKEKMLNEFINEGISSELITFIINETVSFAVDIYFGLHTNRILKHFTGMLESVSGPLLILLIFEEGEKENV